MNRNNLNQAQVRFLTKYDALDMEFDVKNAQSLNSLEKIRERNITNDDNLIEKILQAPSERQDELIDQIYKNGIDIELATNPSLNAAQFREHLEIAHYNYNIEYGHLKDTGKQPINKELVSAPSLTATQLHCIATSHKERLLPERLLKDGSALPENEMIEALSQQRNDHLEYSCRLAEVGVNAVRLESDDNKALFAMYLDGKENQQALTQFNSIISEKTFQNPGLRSNLIQNTLKVGILPEKEPLVKPANLTTNLKNIVKSLFTLDPAIAAMDTFGNVESEKPRVSQHLIDEVNKMQFNSAGTEKEQYFEDPLQQLKLHKDNVEITSLSSESLERAIMVAAVKFGVPLIVEGSEEFKEAVVNAIASNEQLAGITLHGELQEVVNNKLMAPKEDTISKTYELYNAPEKYLEQSDKAYALEYPAYGEPHYLAVNNKDEILQFMKTSVSDLSEEAANSYQNDTLEEFASKYARDEIGDLPVVYDKDRLQQVLDNPELNQRIQAQYEQAAATYRQQPVSNYAVYDSPFECVESRFPFVLQYGATFVAVETKDSIVAYLNAEYPTKDEWTSEVSESYYDGSIENFAEIISEFHEAPLSEVYEIDELRNELENNGGMER